MIPGAYWFSIKDGDPRGLGLYRRHYSSRLKGNGGGPLFVGPGEKTSCKARVAQEVDQRPSREYVAVAREIQSWIKAHPSSQRSPAS